MLNVPDQAAHRGITNERGHPISMWAWGDRDGIHVAAQSPDSDMEHTWTPLEAVTVHNLLGSVLAHHGLLAELSGRCIATTGKGFRCTRSALAGGVHCRVHGGRGDGV